MKVIRTHGRPSFSKDMRKAQFTILVGEGSSRRSVTRHAVRKPDDWVGLNPDDRAATLNDQYEQELAETKEHLSSVTATLEALFKKHNNELDDEAQVKLKAEILIAAASVLEAEELFIKAKLELGIVRERLPREVAFI